MYSERSLHSALVVIMLRFFELFIIGNFQGQLMGFGHGAQQYIQDLVFFCQERKFKLHPPISPLKWGIWGWFIPKAIKVEEVEFFSQSLTVPSRTQIKLSAFDWLHNLS